MINRKFNRFDRQLAQTDLKNRILDMRANPFVIPPVAWDAQPVRYFKLNKQWCKILAGWLEWMEDVSGWQDSEDDSHAGIQGFLEFEVGINGAIFMTPDEFKKGISDGIYQAFNDLAAQLKSGVKGGFTVAEDGTVSLPADGGDAELPEDDPLTPVDENLSAKAGGAIKVADGIQEILARMNTWYAGGTVTQQQAEDRLVLLYGFEADNANVFANYYYTVYMNASGLISLNRAALSGLLYCHGVSVQSFSEYIFEVHSDASEVPTLEVLAENISLAQMQSWFESGMSVPSTDYQAYSCTKITTETFQFDMSTSNAPTYTTNGVWKAGHRYLIEITGSYTDSDLPNIVGDGMYFHDTSTGIKTFSNMNFNFDGSISVPNQALVPFSPTHSYAFTIERNVGSGDAARVISRDNGSMNLPNITGILTVKITDMGEYAI